MPRFNAVAAALASGALAALVPVAAEAHFYLNAPPAWQSQTADGSPQKTAPCGNEAGGTPTGTVTAYRPGDTVTVSVSETVPHPGWYKATLAVNNRSELPADPTPTPGRNSACGDVLADGGISGLTPMSSPVFPVLVDGALFHTTTMTGARTFTVKLPTNVTCTKCTLQIVEYMAEHGSPCFYHHCADISIGAAAADGGATDARVDAGNNRDATATGAGGATATTGAGGTTATTGAGGTTATTGAGGTTATTGAGGTTATTGSGGANGTSSGGATGTGTGGTDNGGCSCAVHGAPASSSVLALALVALVIRRRRRAR